jgi:hypothetical protein
MAKKQSAKDRTDFLNLVLDKKDILFGSLSATLTAQKKQQCWQSIRANLMAAGGSALAEKSTWKSLRDVTWQDCRRRTVQKRDKRAASGAGGPSEDGGDTDWTLADDLVQAIIGDKAANYTGMNVAESGEVEESPVDALLTADRSAAEERQRKRTLLDESVEELCQSQPVCRPLFTFLLDHLFSYFYFSFLQWKIFHDFDHKILMFSSFFIYYLYALCTPGTQC